MAYDRIMKRHARNRGRNRQILSLPQQDWRGVNAVDDIYSMPGHQITPAQNADLGNPVGSITKVAGFESLFPSLGTGQILGLHGWKHPDGDKFIAAWDKYLYLLSGKTGSIAKSSQEDWEAGEGVHIDTTTTPGDIKLAKTGADFSETATLTADFSGTHSNTVAADNAVKLTTGTDTSTKLLLHCNGTNGSTTFTDETGKTVTANGGAKISTAQKVFGTASGLFDGSDDSLTVPDSEDWNFGSGDFTVDFRARFLSLPSSGNYMGLVGQHYNSDIPWSNLYIYNNSGTYQLRYDTGDGIAIYNDIDLSVNTWYHIALVRGGNSWYMFKDGTQIGATATNSKAVPNVAAPLTIGRCTIYGNYRYFHGYLDEIRITKGIARWTADFTPPTSEYAITGYLPSGTYTHPAQDISAIGVTTGVTVAYNKTTPANTAVKVETRTSADGGKTWGGWTARNSGDAVIPSGTDVSKYRVQWRAVLTTTDPAATPALNDVTLAGNAGLHTSGSWLSPAYDLGNTPFTATLSWTQNAPAGTAVAWFARGSGNGKVFGDWREIAASGSAIPLQRYVQVRIVPTGTLTVTPAVQSLLISYSFSYSQANRLDVSPLGRTDNKLTGSRVSFQEYDNRLYCADGLRPFVLYADDSTKATGTAQGLTLNPLFSDYTGTIDDDTGDIFTNWTELNQGTGRIEAVTGELGGVALKANQTAAAGATQYQGVSQIRNLTDMGLVAGDTISARVRYKMNAQNGATVRILITFLTAADAWVAEHWLVQNTTAEVGSYTIAKKENITVPATAAKVQFRAAVCSSEAYSGQNNQLWVDCFWCEKVGSDIITLAADASAVNDYYNNAFITITGGVGAGQVRFISGYNGTSKIVTVTEPWDIAPDATSTYSIGTAVKARNAGVDPPATACKAAEGGSTGISGTFKYKITFVNRDGYESNPSAASDAVTVTSKNVSLTDIPTGDSTIAERKIYRTKGNGAVFYYVATLEDNTTTTYSDTTADTGLSSLMLDNNNIPPNCSLVYSFLTYMFYVFMDELWFSKATEPENVPAIVGDVQNIICPGLILDIKHNPMALIPMGQDFVAPITTSTGFIFDSDPAVDTTTMRVIANSGSLSAWASDICITPDLRSILAFPSRTGIMALLPGLQEESIESFPLSRNIQTYIDKSVNRETMAGIYHNGRYRVSFQHLGETGPEWVTFSCDFRQEGREWHGPWTYGASCYFELDGVLYAGDPQEGKIYRMDTGNSFDGEKIRMVADTRMLAPQGENFTYRYNNFMVMVSAESDTTELIIKPKVDNREASIVPGALVDTFAGDKRAGHDNIRSRKFRIPLARGSTLSYRIEDDSTNPLSIQKIITEAEVLPLKR